MGYASAVCGCLRLCVVSCGYALLVYLVCVFEFDILTAFTDVCRFDLFLV